MVKVYKKKSLLAMLSKNVIPPMDVVARALHRLLAVRAVEGCCQPKKSRSTPCQRRKIRFLLCFNENERYWKPRDAQGGDFQTPLARSRGKH
jgi:hypothetical protein